MRKLNPRAVIIEITKEEAYDIIANMRPVGNYFLRDHVKNCFFWTAVMVDEDDIEVQNFTSIRALERYVRGLQDYEPALDDPMATFDIEEGVPYKRNRRTHAEMEEFRKQLAEDKKNGTTKSWRERPLRRRRDTSGL